MESLVELAHRAKHDLGKYIAFQVRWLPEEASDDELLTALRADLLATHSGADEVRGAVEIWAELAPAMREGFPADELAALERSLERIAALSPGVREGSLERSVLEEARREAIAVGAELSRLNRLARRG